MRRRWFCGLGCGWISYSPGFYGADGPIPVHLLNHHMKEGALDGPFSTGPESQQCGRLMPAEKRVAMPLDEDVDTPVSHEDTARALRAFGCPDLAADFERVVRERRVAHYEAMADEAVAS